MKRKQHKGKRRKSKAFILVRGNKVYLQPARKIPAMSYYEYIGSPYWKVRKLRYYHFNGRACAVCDTTENVQLHHLCYKPKLYGREPDTDLVALCSYHHNLFHETHGGVPPEMKAKTLAFIQTLRQLAASSIDDLSWIK